MNSRREFLKGALGATLVTAVAPVVCSCGSKVMAMGEPPAEIQGTIELPQFLSSHTALKTLDGSVVKTFPITDPNRDNPILFITTGISPYTFNVFSAKCTHNQAQVNPYNKTKKYILCPAHLSRFDINGNVIQSPAQSPLSAYTYSYDETNDIMYVSGTPLVDGVNTRANLSLDLGQNHPNPVAGHTTISFVLPEACQAQISVFDLNGSQLATIIDAVLPAGQHTNEFDATALLSGVYLYRLVTPNDTLVRQMVKQ